MISRRDLLKRTGISAATLDGYIALGIVPAGDPGEAPEGRSFPDSAVARIEEVRSLKSAGLPMAAITARFAARSAAAAPDPGDIVALPQLELDEIAHPAYLLDRSFELTWCNELARKDVLGIGAHASPGEARNIFLLLLDVFANADPARCDSLLRVHLAFAKARLSRLSMSGLLKNVEPHQAQLIARLYDDAAVITGRGVAELPYELGGDNGTLRACKAYGIFVRDGVLIVHTLA